MRFCCFKNVEKKLGKNLQPLRYLTWITIHSLFDNILPYYAMFDFYTLYQFYNTTHKSYFSHINFEVSFVMDLRFFSFKTAT